MRGSFLVLASLAASSASLGVICDGDVPDLGGEILSQLPEKAAMSFSLLAGATVTGLERSGGRYSVLTYGNQMATGNRTSYSTSLQAFSLPANTTYFLAIQEIADEPSRRWGWETASSALSNLLAERLGVGA